MPSTKSKDQIQLPDEIDIFSTKWRLIYSDSPYEMGDARATASPLFGQCNFIDRSIEIYKGNRSRADIWKTIFHEVLHAVINELGVHEIEDSDNYESIVDTLSVAIVDIITRNKISIL